MTGVASPAAAARGGTLRSVASYFWDPVSGVMTENLSGVPVPAIPHPIRVGFSRVWCECGERFWSIRAYRGHYALEHILELE